MKLNECRAVITGASGGIGQALVAALLAEGAQLLLVGRQTDVLQALANARHL
jgi:short-subunit dehydrogenase